MCVVTQSSLSLCDPMDFSPLGSSVHGDSPGKYNGVGCHALLQWHFPYYVFHHPETDGLIELWNKLLKTQIQCYLAEHILYRWGKILKDYTCSKFTSNIWSYFFHSQYSLGSRNNGVITIILINPLEKFVLLILVIIPVTPSGIGILVPKEESLPLRHTAMDFIKLEFECLLYTSSLSCIWIN